MTDFVMKHLHKFLPCEPNEAQGFAELHEKLDLIIRNQGFIMATFDELKEAQAAVAALVGKVKVDVNGLHALIEAIPPVGMTAEQQAALDEAVTTAKAIVDSLAAVDVLTADPVAAEPAAEA